MVRGYIVSIWILWNPCERYYLCACLKVGSMRDDGRNYRVWRWISGMRVVSADVRRGVIIFFERVANQSPIHMSIPHEACITACTPRSRRRLAYPKWSCHATHTPADVDNLTAASTSEVAAERSSVGNRCRITQRLFEACSAPANYCFRSSSSHGSRCVKISSAPLDTTL